MKYLFVVAALLIGYGSLYPFDFRAEGAPFRVLFQPGTSGLGDLLQNVALFLPFGYLGMVAWRRPRGPLRFAMVTGAAAIYGAALQVAQLYVPERDPALRDVMPNVIGAAAGALVGAIPFLDMRRLGDRAAARPVPPILIGFWLAYRLSPFVPSINRQEWADGAKPLLGNWLVPWSSVVNGAVAWAAVGCLWAAAPPGRLGIRWLPALVAATLGLQIVIVDNVLTPANVLGAAIGLLVVPLLIRVPWRYAVAALLVAGAILIEGLEPFRTGASTAFEWLPFQGFLQGSMLTNSRSLFEKAFYYSALIWFAREAGLRLGVAAGAAALLLAGIEGAQTRVPGHTPEITDPLLALFAALFLRVADAPHAPPNPVESPERRKEES